eukprot:508573_1
MAQAIQALNALIDTFISCHVVISKNEQEKLVSGYMNSLGKYKYCIESNIKNIVVTYYDTISNDTESNDATLEQMDYLCLTVKQTMFKIKKTTKLQKLMDTYCAHVGKLRSSIIFSFNGRQIEGNNTPQQLGMKDEDEIDAHIKYKIIKMQPLRSFPQQEALVFGYCRIQCATYTCIPDILCILCFQFFNEIYYFNYKADKFNQFVKIPKNRKIIDELQIFNMKQFIIEICIHSIKANKHMNKAFIIPYITMKPSSSHINTYVSAVIAYHFLCFQTKSECKDIVIWTKNTNTTIHGLEPMWTFGNNMTSSDCAQFKELSFGIHFDIASVKYVNIPRRLIELYRMHNPKKLNDIASLKQILQGYKGGEVKLFTDLNEKYENIINYNIKAMLCSSIIYEWNIDNELLAQMKECKYGKMFYSNNFENDYFCLSVAPNGWSYGNKGITYLYLRLLKLPIGIGSMNVNYEIYYIDDNAKPWTYAHTIDLNSNTSSRISRTMCDFSKILSVSTLKFRIAIVIKHIYDEQNEEINKEQWNQFGVINIKTLREKTYNFSPSKQNY